MNPTFGAKPSCWTVSAPLIRIHEPFGRGAPLGQLLDELEPTLGEGAYAVVETARDLDAFIDLYEAERCNERENRRRLRTAPTEFTPAASEVRTSLEGILRLVRLAAPQPADLTDIAECAHRVATWAEERGAVATALTFLQLAQEVDEDAGRSDPQLQYDLGRVAVTVPEHREGGIAWLDEAAARAGAVGRGDLAEQAASLAAQMRAHVGEAVV